MKRILLASILATSLLGSCKGLEEESDLQNLHVSTSNNIKKVNAAIEIYQKGLVKIAVIDMVHVGPKEYYDLVNYNMSEIVSSAPGNSYLLLELIQCSGKVLTVDPSKFQSGSMPNFFDESAGSTADLETKISDMKAMGFVTTTTCVDGKHPLRGQMAPERRRLAAEYGLVYQEDVFNTPAIAGVEAINADIDLSKAPEVMQFLAALAGVQSKFSPSEMAANYPSLHNWFLSTAGQRFYRYNKKHLIMDARNEALFKVIRRLAQRDNTIIVPWGANHSPFIYDFLKSERFARRSGISFKFAECEELSVVPFYNGIENMFCR